MSRRLVHGRSRQNDASSASTPVQRRHREDEAAGVELPPYEPPSCALSARARIELNKLRDAEDDLRKYRQHLDFSQKTIPEAVAQLNDKANKRKQANEKWVAKRVAEGMADEEKTDAEKDDELSASVMVKKSKELTQKSEKALREVIDYGDELSMHSHMIAEVIDNIAAVPPPQVDAIEDEVEEALDVTSAVELLDKARADYAEAYRSKPMVKR